MKAAQEDREPDVIPASAPWWAHLAIRHGITALIALGALYILAEQIRAFPVKMEQLADKVSDAIKVASDAQIRVIEAAERRSEERARLAVQQIMSQIEKNK